MLKNLYLIGSNGCIIERSKETTITKNGGVVVTHCVDVDSIWKWDPYTRIIIANQDVLNISVKLLVEGKIKKHIIFQKSFDTLHNNPLASEVTKDDKISYILSPDTIKPNIALRNVYSYHIVDNRPISSSTGSEVREYARERVLSNSSNSLI